MVAQWLGEDVHQVAPTFGFTIKTLCIEPYRVHFWDIGGQRSIRPFWRNYFEETDGLVFVIDAAAPYRFHESIQELTELLAQDRLANASLLILANKQDCQGAVSATVIEEQLRLVNGLGDKSGKTHWALRGSTAIIPGDPQVKEALEWLINDVAERLYHSQNPIHVE